MRVHVIALDDNWILHRYAGILSKRLGWTVGLAPRDDVDVNHYIPYLLYEWKDRHPANTKASAWFTHLEENERRASNPRSKVSRWHRAASAMNLRLCQADKYRRILEPLGPTAQMPTSVDIRRFKPKPLRVGVAGRVYRTGRKGERLVEALVKRKEFQVVGSGTGWPCPTRMYVWPDLPGFFQSLDVFLVTSTVEGGPDTILEALATGLPIVAPRDVGFCDEFDLYHYDKGDFDGMLAQLQGIDSARQERRQQILHRTEAGWAQAHLRAFQEYLS